MADAGSWPSIAKYGLLSTTALLDLYKINGNCCTAIESQHRPDSVPIEREKFGRAVIRDQKPMRESALRKCLLDCEPKDWYEFLNHKVFFWVTEDRVKTLLKARAYRAREHLVIMVDTKALLDEHGDRALLSPINSGSTIYKPVGRGLNSFQSLDAYPYEERRRLRGRAHAIAELAFDYSVPNIEDFVVQVARRKAEKVLEVIHARS